MAFAVPSTSDDPTKVPNTPSGVRRTRHKKSASDTFAFAAGSFLQPKRPEDILSFIGPESLGATLLDDVPFVPGIHSPR